MQSLSNTYPHFLRCPSSDPETVLVVDDETSILSALERILKEAGYKPETALNAKAALKLIKDKSFDYIICDLMMPKCNGIEFIKMLPVRSKPTPVILMSAYATLETAFEAISVGAVDYIAKPFIPEDILWTITKAKERTKLKKENFRLQNELQKTESFSEIVGSTPAMQSIFEKIRKISDYSTTVLIEGESGTGKELVARAIHRNSHRRNKNLIAVNCGAIPETLLESELFGHKKGSFTGAMFDRVGLFEEANGGTILLDEIGELPLRMQVKLLRVLQEGEIRPVGSAASSNVDVRIIAATLRNLEEDIASGRFREDLFYRLNVINLRLPPLRERAEDIPLLIKNFISRNSSRLDLNSLTIEKEAHELLCSHNWPGNVRELENTLEQVLILSGGNSVKIENLPVEISSEQTANKPTSAASIVESDKENLSIKKQSRKLEKQLIINALEITGGNRTHAAKLLEISHRTLLYKIKEYELD